jgi:hypothetical protein
MIMVKKLWAAVDGNKTNIGFIVGGLYSILIATTDIENLANPEVVWSAIAMWTGVAVRDAIKKTQK